MTRDHRRIPDTLQAEGISRRALLTTGVALAAAPLLGQTALGQGAGAGESPLLQAQVTAGSLPPLKERLPQDPLVVDLPAHGRRTGTPGGEMTTLIARARDIRYLSANAYTRLVGYTEQLQMQPDVLAAVDVVEGRIFTLRLRRGHRWSDGHPFTSEDFRYYWQDIIRNPALTPSGPPLFLLADGQEPKFEVLDEITVRYSWPRPNPLFLPTLAGPQDPYIYRPAHVLRQYHVKYAPAEQLAELVKKARVKSWAPLHNRMDAMLENSSPTLPTLFPWRPVEAGATRIIFERNPYFHRIDSAGAQLPYVDRVIADIASASLFAAKTNAGEVDVLARGLIMSDIPVLKQGEKAHDYATLLWRMARGSELALYPNLTVADPMWRALNRDVRWRRALSLSIDRHTINNALLFGLGKEGNNTVMEGSAMFRPEYRSRWAQYDPAQATRLLDEMGLKAAASGIRTAPDGRPLEVVVEVDSDTGLAVDTLELITEFWREVGIKLFIKPQDRTILRNRAYEGRAVMVASAGLDNAIPTAQMAPTELAPVQQDNMSWPRWGQYAETKGKSGEACDDPQAKKLLVAMASWMNATDEAVKARAWHEMLGLHSENVWSIGTVAGALQPVALRNGLINFPKTALYSWAPTALLGIYRMDELFWDRPERRGSNPA